MNNFSEKINFIWSISPVLTGGSKKTAEPARKHWRPCLHISAQAAGVAGTPLLRDFVEQHRIRMLNVAVARASEELGISAFVKPLLDEMAGVKRD
jgi:hypothetical protein